MNRIGRTAKGRRALLALACMFAVAGLLFQFSGLAFAYFNMGAVSVSPGASSLNVTAGSSGTMSISVSPSSAKETVGCGMAECPQACGAGCLDSNGQCTCAGKGYSTYTTNVSAYSSNSGVASAYVSGGTLVVTGNSAGSATITITGSLRQHSDGVASVYVQVSEPASGGGAAATGGGTAVESGSASSGASGNEAAEGAVAAVTTITSSGVPEAVSTSATDSELNEQVVQTAAGKVYTVQNNSFLKTSDELARIAGTDDRVIIWSGASSDRPDYSWTFVGSKLKNGQSTDFDPTISISPEGTGDVANIMQQAGDGLVMDFAHSGNLPGTATVYVKVGSAYADNTTLGLYCFDEETRQFRLVDDAVKVSGGYSSFDIDHCSTWALSEADLTTYSVQNAAGMDEAASSHGGGTSVIPIVLAIAGVCAAAALATYFLKRHARKPQAATAQDANAPKAAEGADEAAQNTDKLN